uniref:Tc1-like transposase DDE domain-containing protein n=1 Tax=Oncorhynchus tshawytscha TaxID=74940 RepID=A0AAZ3R129_ONCTS
MMCFAGDTVSDLFRIQGTLNQHGYHSILVGAWWDYHLFFNRTMTQHISRLCKGYLTEKESDGVLHHMTWPPQSPDLNPIEMVWDELDSRVKEKQSTSAQHMWELLQDCLKNIPGEAGLENSKSAQSFLATT